MLLALRSWLLGMSLGGAASHSRAQPPPPACAVAALLAQWPGVVGLVALLLWAACDLAAAAWAALRHRPELLSELSAARPGAAAALQQAMDAEAALDHATLALMRAALPALPAALLGLLLGEGGKLVSRAAAEGWVRRAGAGRGWQARRSSVSAD